MTTQRNTEEWMGWWTVWLRRRDIDEYRSWVGKNHSFRTYISLDKTEANTYLLPSVSFEDRLVDLLDFEAAWTQLSEHQRQLLMLSVEGYNDIEIAKLFHTTQSAVAGRKKRSRHTLRKACEVKYK